jgi:deoxycytidine triphosphate deaminase
MIIGIDRLKKLIKEKGLIEGLDESDMNFEGVGVDLRLGEVYEMGAGQGKLLIDTRDSPKFKLIGKFKKGKSKILKIRPGRIYLGKTVETINTPKGLFGWFIPRATFYRNGILVQGIRTDPSYKGNFVFMLSNLSDRAFEIELGARVASMVFHTVSGKSNKYIGQWQGGRVFIKKAERQTRQK